MKFADLLKYAVSKRASDLHIIAGLSPVIRVDGEIIVTEFEPLTADTAAELLLADLNEERRRVLETNMRLCYSLTVPDAGYFRISLYYSRGTVGGAVRVGISKMRTLEELGLPSVTTEFTRKPSGLILITGPTGSGKTTTLNSMIDMINRERRCKIIMVEDPIEYVHSNKRSIVVQQEVLTDTPTFGDALVHILRQDPDVIGVGEMRDLETISTALTAAETGHLVISTLHTPDAPQTIDRVVDVFPPAQQSQIRVQLANCLHAVISQQLLPRVDIDGRILACEIMIANQATRNIIRENKTQTLYNAIMTGNAEGMQTMDSCLKNLYQQGIITYDTAVTRARFPNELRLHLNGSTAGVAGDGFSRV